MSTLANSEDPDEMTLKCGISSGSALFAKIYYIQSSGNEVHNNMLTRIVRESDYSPAAALFMQEKGQVLKIFRRKI